MPSDRRRLRGKVLTEDKRTERFFRKLLKELGFTHRNFLFNTAPQGEGAADAWVALRYPAEVKALRSQNFQRGLRLIAVRDGDLVGLEKRKQQLDQALQDAGSALRQADEKIALPVPTRNIKTWLLALLGSDTVEETADYKHHFENEHGVHETKTLANNRCHAFPWWR